MALLVRPARVIFGDMIDSDLAMDLPAGTTAQNPEDYLVKLWEAQSILVQTTQDYLKKNQRKRKRGVDGEHKIKKSPILSGGLRPIDVSKSSPKQTSRDVSWPNGYHGDGSSGSRKS